VDGVIFVSTDQGIAAIDAGRGKSRTLNPAINRKKIAAKYLAADKDHLWLVTTDAVYRAKLAFLLKF
jgi:ligand-binding sensor domain-containing protein